MYLETHKIFNSLSNWIKELLLHQLKLEQKYLESQETCYLLIDLLRNLNLQKLQNQKVSKEKWQEERASNPEEAEAVREEEVEASVEELLVEEGVSEVEEANN